jgi:hypothetical protein
LDEFERGYPRMLLPLLMDVIGACLAQAEKPPRSAGRSRDADPDAEFQPRHKLLASPAGREALRKRLHAANLPGHAISWRALLGRLARLNRLKVFYDEEDGVKPLNYADLLRPGSVSVIDLSDTGYSELNNLVIADLLRGVQDAQEAAYEKYEAARAAGREEVAPPRVLLIIEEAHEFLSEERIGKTPILFQQVARISKRGRKRWLGLAFVTQLPQHLPRQLLALVNNFVLHKITDSQVIGVLRKTISNMDEGLWTRLPGLAPGQAIVSFTHMTRPLLTSIDPAGAKLRMVD